MIQDTRYINNNFKNSKSKIMRSLDIYDSIVELNTQYHTVFLNEEKKKIIKNMYMYLFTSNAVFFTLLGILYLLKSPFILYSWMVPATMVSINIAWNIVYLIYINSVSYGSFDNLIPYKENVSLEEYMRYYNIKLPKETLPDWMFDKSVVYSKDSFDDLLCKYNEPKIQQFLAKYKRLAFKSNKIIANNKKILSSWTKEARENLVVVDIIPLTLVDYKSIWKEAGFSDEVIEESYLLKMKELE